MKLATFAIDRVDRLGALLPDGRMIDLAETARRHGADAQPFASMQALIEAGETGLDAARALLDDGSRTVAVDLGAAKLRAPLPRPVQMRDCLSFEMHLKNAFESTMKLAARRQADPAAAEAAMRASGRYAVPEIWYRQPIYYKANRFAVSDPDAAISWPAYSAVMDFELEIACVIGRGGCDIAAADVDAHIFGYTIFNDFSARDAQAAEQSGTLGPAKGKDFDGANAMGPVIVTRDELPDPYALAMRARVNGETWTDGSTATMHWRFPAIIEHISRGETLYPGEVIGSGTVGWGCGLEHMRFLADGDEVELEIEGIGILRNRVFRSQAAEVAA